MRISVLQENLSKALSIINRAVPSKPVLPVLANVLIQTEGQRLKLSSTNLELGINVWIGGKVDQDGAVTLPAKTFLEMINTLASERIDMELNPKTQVVNVRCGGTTANIKGIHASEYPLVPEADPEKGIPVSASALREMIGHVAFAAATVDNRPVLTGILMRFQGETLTLAATDGYRVSERTTELIVHMDAAREIIVPVKTMVELARLLGDETGDVLVTLPEGRNQVMFHLPYIDVISSLVEGIFPAYEGVIPKTHIVSCQVYTSELLRACKRSEVFARDAAYSSEFHMIPADTGPGRMTVSARSPEKGDNEVLVDASIKGEALKVSFNVRYMTDVISSIKEDQVTLECAGIASPCIIRPVGRQDFTHVIMPMSGARK